MSALAQQQQALLQALWTRPGETPPLALAALVAAPWQRGLVAYRTNAAALAERALLAAYPVVAALISADSFAPMARQFWFQHPPECGDLACWGEALPGFLAGEPQLADVPYLADVARVEWALHRSAGAPDAPPFAPDSFILLTGHAPDRITLRLPPGMVVLHSGWPVVSLVNAHLQQEPAFDTVAGRVQACAGETALVWRQGLRPCLATCSQAEAALVETLLAGQSLLVALEAVDAVETVPAVLAGDDHDGGAAVPFDFSDWLNAAVTQGQVLGAALLP
jgi:hypothetical protein